MAQRGASAGLPVSGALPEHALLTPAIVKNLTDKLYERRKLGALEIEQLVKEMRRNGDKEKLVEIIRIVREDFLESTSQNTRKGGLIAMAAIALGLGQSIGDHITDVLPSVIGCFNDPDHKVRYYACESLYNITKIARGHAMRFFNEIFDSLCKLAADPDKSVRDGAELLDRLLKDVLSEGHRFDVAKFVPLLAERVHITSPECRRFLVSWIRLLDAIPDVELLEALPHFLDGLLKMLSDRYEDIRQSVDTCLAEFLQEIKITEERWKAYNAHTDGEQTTAPMVIHYGSMVQQLIPHCRSKDEFTSLTALHWLFTFIAIAGDRLFPLCAKMLSGVLPQVASKSAAIEKAARLTNSTLKALVKQSDQELPVAALLETITRHFKNENMATRIFALKWILVLNLKNPVELVSQLDNLFPSLLKMLSDANEEVVRLDLQVLAKLSSNAAYFERLMANVLALFRASKRMLEGRASLIVRQLCLYIPPEQIFRALASLLEHEEDPQFVSVMVQTLNLILLTAPELVDVKNSLRSVHTEHSRNLFSTLYRSWCYNEAAVFSLCLLAQVYEHACTLIYQFAELDLTVNTLMEMDKLVQLLESPIFLSLRLQLLEPIKNAQLFKALYGLLMLLPQGTAFHTLRKRLAVVSSASVLGQLPSNTESDTLATRSPPVFDFQEMLQQYRETKERQREYLVQQRLKEEKKRTQAIQRVPEGSAEKKRSPPG